MANKLSGRGDRRRRHRPRGRAGGHRGAGSGGAALRLRPRMARIRLELRDLRQDRPDDAGRRARPAAALRLGISRRGRLSRRAGPRLAVGAADPAAPQLPAIHQPAAGAAAGRGRYAAEGPRARRHRFLCRAREQRGRILLDRRPDLRGHRHGDGDAAGGVHPARLRPGHALRLRAGPHPQEARHLGHQVERHHPHDAVLGRALRGDRRATTPTSRPTSTTSTS